MLITLSRSLNTVGCEMSTNTRSRQDREPLAWVIGFTPSQQHHLTKVAKGLFKWVYTDLGWPLLGQDAFVVSNYQVPNRRARHRLTIWGIMLPCAQGVPRKSDTIGSEIFSWNTPKRPGSIVTSQQAMPLRRDSQPAARETRAVHTADIRITEPNGTDIWVDVRVGVAKPDCSVPEKLARVEQEKRREYGIGTSNPSTLFDGVVPVIFEQHGCPGPCAITFFHILRRGVHKLEQGSHLTHGVA